ncbi:MAG: TrkA family potassium uptake protein, partial [Actinomycetia bacterium]|nr:TrkA family potassium uptake protein [Actinomycetes bacterium]
DIDTIRELQQQGIPAILGDPTDVKGLTLAGAKAARYIIANREDEEDNVEIVLAASGISEAEVFAVIDDISHAHYFRYAGASHVLSPKKILGAHLAEKATASWRDELFGAGELVSEWFIIEFPIFPGSPFDGLTLREASIPERCGATLVGIWHRGNLELEPGSASMISAENVLVAVGRREKLLKLQELTRTIEVPEITERRHCVIAGYGDVGRAIKEVLDSQGVSSTIIDARKKSGHYIQGDATDEKIIHRANIADAASFFAASHIDRDNIFSTLVARKINPDIHILARANSRESTDQLYRAGADFVFSLSTIAAQMLADMLIGDHVTTLAEGLKVLSIPVDKKLADKRLGRLRVRTLTGCTVIAVARADGSLLSNPGPDLEMKQGMTIIILGYARQVREFKKRFL